MQLSAPVKDGRLVWVRQAVMTQSCRLVRSLLVRPDPWPPWPNLVDDARNSTHSGGCNQKSRDSAGLLFGIYAYTHTQTRGRLLLAGKLGARMLEAWRGWLARLGLDLTGSRAVWRAVWKALGKP